MLPSVGYLAKTFLGGGANVLSDGFSAANALMQGKIGDTSDAIGAVFGGNQSSVMGHAGELAATGLSFLLPPHLRLIVNLARAVGELLHGDWQDALSNLFMGFSGTRLGAKLPGILSKKGPEAAALLTGRTLGRSLGKNFDGAIMPFWKSVTASFNAGREVIAKRAVAAVA